MARHGTVRINVNVTGILREMADELQREPDRDLALRRVFDRRHIRHVAALELAGARTVLVRQVDAIYADLNLPRDQHITRGDT